MFVVRNDVRFRRIYWGVEGDTGIMPLQVVVGKQRTADMFRIFMSVGNFMER